MGVDVRDANKYLRWGQILEMIRWWVNIILLVVSILPGGESGVHDEQHTCVSRRWGEVEGAEQRLAHAQHVAGFKSVEEIFFLFHLIIIIMRRRCEERRGGGGQVERLEGYVRAQVFFRFHLPIVEQYSIFAMFS